MRKLQYLFIAIGTVTFLYLLRKMGVGNIWGALRLVGWGFILILSQEIVAYLLNTLGWRYSFSPGFTPPFKRLLHLRIAGDGLNYLTPSVTLAGEWARTTMLGDAIPLSERLSSVVMAKLTQGIAQGLMASSVILWVALHKISWSQIKNQVQSGTLLLGGLLLVVVILEIRAWKSGKKEESTNSKPEASGWQAFRKLDKNIGSFIRNYPIRFALSVFFFFLGFLWGGFEAYWIAHFLNVPITVSTALCIETLSVLMDGLFIMVPAKVGTQEATKTAIFASLGLSPKDGFTFGLIRHLREISWALVGLYFLRSR
ncbi:MAG: flippase-like domain-containing protein [Elusimicrobia bacterium]|nr:flippase-like domain-containing protein [Elusimicrobiota bacterium]